MNDQFSYPIAVLTASVGLVAGMLLVTLAPGDETAQRYVLLPEYQLWRLAIAVQAAFILTVAPTVILRAMKLVRPPDVTWSSVAVWLPIVIMLLLFVLPAGIRAQVGIQLPMRGQWLRMGVLQLAASVVIVGGIGGFGLIAGRFKLLRNRIQTLSSEAQDVASVRAVADQYLRLRGDARWFVAILGAMVAMVTLATGALGASVAALLGVEVDAGPIPPPLVLAYGTYFSAALAIAYGPLHVLGGRLGRGIREDMLGQASGSDYAKLRSDLGEQLQLDGKIAGSLESSVAVLAPLLAALFSELVAK